MLSVSEEREIIHGGVFVASNEIFFTRALASVSDVCGRNTHNY